MLNFTDFGIWTYVSAGGPGATAELLELESMLVVQVPEGKSHPWAMIDGMIHFLQRDGQVLRFPRGFVFELIPRLQKHGIQVQHIRDQRSPRNFDQSGWDGFYRRLRHQAQGWATEQMWTHREGIAKLFTRFGKSYVTAAAWVACGRPHTVLAAPRTDILRQMRDELSEWLGEPIGVICSDVGAPSIQRLTLISLPSVFTEYDDGRYYPRSEYITWLNDIEAVWLDECHISGELAFALHMATQNRIIQWALSATPFVNDAVKDMQLVGFTGPVRLEMGPKQGADLGLISSMLVRWYDVHCAFDLMPPGGGMADYVTRMMVENPMYNSLIAHIAKHHIDAGDPVVIFVDRIQHGKNIAALIPGAVANVGAVSSATKKQLQADFNEGRIRCVVTTKRWREGITLRTNVLINAEGFRAEHVQEQRSGRGLMPKDDGRPLVVYEFAWSDPGRNTLQRWSRERARYYTSIGWPQQHVGSIEVLTLEPSNVQ